MDFKLRFSLHQSRLQFVVAAQTNEHLSFGDPVAFACEPTVNNLVSACGPRGNGQGHDASLWSETAERCDLFGLAGDGRWAWLGFQHAPADGPRSHNPRDDQTLAQSVAICGLDRHRRF